jgi:ubiquinone/menaquinone biosynthesis C-methylase UbiE
MTGNVRVSIDVSLAPAEAFDTLVDELVIALDKLGLKFDASPGGSIMEGNFLVGTVKVWRPGESISFTWRPKSWEDQQNGLNVIFRASDGGTNVTIESREWNRIVSDDGKELLGWFASEVAGPLINASAPNRLGDWITDRIARHPSGSRARGVYRSPTYHYPNFFAILDRLSLQPDDYLLDVGCGGGAFLYEAMKSGCRAAAVDHSADMVRVAKDVNQEAISQRMLSIEKSEADSLPFADRTFTCAVMTGVLGFIPDPLAAFKEIFRVLRPAGRLMVFTSTKKLKGTPAAPEPAASRLRFYEDLELENLGKQAGFASVRVEHPSLYEYAKKAGVPESDLVLFSGTDGDQLLVVRK